MGRVINKVPVVLVVCHYGPSAGILPAINLCISALMLSHNCVVGHGVCGLSP